MLSQKRAVKEPDLYGKAASKFLSLIPRCCHPESLPSSEREEEHATWSKGKQAGGGGGEPAVLLGVTFVFATPFVSCFSSKMLSVVYMVPPSPFTLTTLCGR